MILASHVIVSAYGFWLPNEERGSWSDFVRKYELWRDFGPATKVDTTRSVAWKPFDWARRETARASLMYPRVVWTGVQARGIGRGFRTMVRKSGYDILALAIQPEHVHFVVRRFRYQVEQITNLLKGAASNQLIDEGIHPFQNTSGLDGTRPSMWSVGLWKVFLDSDEDVSRSIEYVNRNPQKSGRKPQKWDFVVEY